MPGRRRLWTYSARPVTLARASSARQRAADLARRHDASAITRSPPAPPVTARAQIDAQAAPACRRPSRAGRLRSAASATARIAGARSSASSMRRAARAPLRRRQPHRLSRSRRRPRCADRRSRRPARQRHRDAERRPIIGRARRAFEIGRAPARLRRHDQLGDQLVVPQHRLEIAGEERLDRDRRARRAAPTMTHRGAERDPAPAADPDAGRHGRGCRRWSRRCAPAHWRASATCRAITGAARAHRRRVLERGQRRHRADRSAPSGSTAMRRKRGSMRAQADEPERPVKPRLHHQHQRGAAGDRPDRRIVAVEQRDRLAQACAARQARTGSLAARAPLFLVIMPPLFQYTRAGHARQSRLG